MPTWIDEFRRLLCLIYETWGGDCDDLGSSPSSWIAAVQGQLDTHGVPSGLTQAMVDALDEHLDEPENSLSQADDQAARDLVVDLNAGMS